MSPLITLPVPDFVADTDANADDIDANFAAILSVVNGGIDDSNISSAARIDGNKLSSESGKQVPEDRLATNAVSNRVLSSHVTTDASRAVTTDHLRDLCVTAAKVALLAVDSTKMTAGAALANLAANSVGLPKLNITVATAPLSMAIASGAAAQALSFGTVAVAGYQLIGAYAKNLAGAAGTFSLAIDGNDGSTNWSANAKLIGPSASGTLTGTAVLVFASKT